MPSPVYMDTSAVVALLVRETRSAAVDAWYAGSTATLVTAAWCVPEFASALSMKIRTGHLSTAQADQAWQRFDQLTAVDLELLPLGPGAYAQAAALCRMPALNVRAGDALHLACAQAAGVRGIVTLDEVQARAAKVLKIKPLELR
jgi:predicted nucleic acid-binding protein